jgi:uncharacterized damage-inducible protein DinB
MKLPENQDSVLARYKNGLDLLEDALSGLRDCDLDMRLPSGGWSVRQIVHHIADGDDIWKLCIKMALGNAKTEFTLAWYRTLSQDEWTERWDYNHRSIDESLALLKSIRKHIIQLLERIPDGWSRSTDFRTATGEIERLPVGFVIGMQADHVEHHVRQIREIRREHDRD